jgi:hypothetical protein
MNQAGTPKKEACIPKFLRVFAECGNVLAACRAAGIGRRTYYRWRATDPEFDAACRHAADDALDSLEEAGWQRARETSDTLLIFFLKAGRPEKYRDRATLEILMRFQGMSDDELNGYLRERMGAAAALGAGSVGSNAFDAREPGESGGGSDALSEPAR